MRILPLLLLAACPKPDPEDTSPPQDTVPEETGDTGVEVASPCVAAPILVTSQLTITSSAGLAVADGILAVADGYDGLSLWDVSSPSTPVPLGTWDSSGFGYDVALQGGLALLADGSGGGLRLVNVNDPTVPSFIGGVMTSGEASGVVVSDNQAWLVDGSAGLSVIDVSEPSTASVVGSVDAWESTEGVAVDGSVAWALDASGQVRAIDTGTFQEVGTWITTSGSLLGIQARDGTVYYGDATTFTLLDGRDPTAPVAWGSVDVGSPIQDVALQDSCAFLAADNGGLVVVDVADPRAPFVVATLYVPEAMRRIGGVAVTGDFAWLSDRDRGFHGVRIPGPP